MTARRFHRVRRPEAFTLVEVLLTLCILVALTALVWPALEKPFAARRLRLAADRVRTEFCSARVEAMDSGQVYIFEFMLESNRFRIRSRAAEINAGASVYGDVLDDLPDGGSTGQSTKNTLPKDVTFVAGEAAADTRAAFVVSEAEQLDALASGWTGPILFYPDGTTSTARLTIKNQYGRYIDLTLRGLTGTVTVGELRMAEEQLP